MKNSFDHESGVPTLPLSLALARAILRICVLLYLTLASCSQGLDLSPLTAGPRGPYRLSAGDQVRVITFGQDQLTEQFLVNDQGKVDLPLIGSIAADGATTDELGLRIQQKLIESKILLTPSVAVEVVKYRPMFILGEVAKPGEYSYQPGMTVLTAAALAGGFTYRAETNYVAMLRKMNGHTVEGRVPRGAEVLPGDVITVLERYF